MHSLVHFSPAARAFNTNLARSFFTDSAETAPQVLVDVTESDTAYTLRANVPGVAKEDVTVSIDGNVVKLEVDFKAEEGEDKIWHERASGKATRALKFKLPIDSDGATAKQEHGVLTLTLPKKLEAQAKRVTIQ
jgi:HSP20 family protein